jgi:2,4-dichlorophenol 6-monooxygenase
VLFERHPSTSILPKAHIINQRTLEIFRQYGIADAIIKKGTPTHQMSQVLWQTSLGGNGPLDRKLLGSIDAWGCKIGTSSYLNYQ